MSYKRGDRVGDYEVVDVLGAGGMGKVYKVRNLISQRVEAMKVLLPDLQADPELADRFMREIRVQASLQHPNIAALHTALRVSNQLLMLIEYVEGTSLDHELSNGPIPVAKATGYIRQVLVALAYAHNNGVVHRDIKPANIMLTPDGTVKLMDFGIARLAEDRRLTQTGRAVGSLYYMSPEQIQGALDIDGRSDVYSLGVTLYEMVTARRPFQGDSDYSIMAAHLSAHPRPPIELDPSLPKALNDAILRAIAKDPAQRFQSAEEFRTELEAVAGTREPQASIEERTARVPVQERIAPQRPSAFDQQFPPPPPQPRRGLYVAIGALATVAVLAIIALQGPRLFSPGEASAKRTDNPAASTQPLAVPPDEVRTSPEAPPTEDPVPQKQERPPAAKIAQGVTPRTEPRPAPAAGGTGLAEQATTSPVSPPQGVAAQAPPQPAPSTGTAAPPAVASPDAREVSAAREALMLLGTRAGSVKASLGSLKRQQAAAGTNLRGDVLTAEQRMEFYLDEAQSAIGAGDPAKAKTSLAAAERALEVIEKFLGR